VIQGQTNPTGSIPCSIPSTHKQLINNKMQSDGDNYSMAVSAPNGNNFKINICGVTEAKKLP
jgi:hypothetical protein